MTQRPPAPPPRPVEAHKGTFGTVIVVGGSVTMIGAPAICAAAALRIGAGLVKLATPPAILPSALTIEPGATGILLPPPDGSDAEAGAESLLDRQLSALDEADPDEKAVLAVGPGLGTAGSAGRLVAALLRGSRTIVLDADGLNLLAATGSARSSRGPALVMTPHPGEFRRLADTLAIAHDPTDPDQRPSAATALARAHHAVVLLKGRHTVVADDRGNRLWRNTTGNPALAAAGAGDVLTGAIAGLIAQGLTPYDAACLGAHVHGLAADRWAERHGPAGLGALELAKALPDALNELRIG